MDADAPLTAGVVLGDAALRDFAARTPTLWLTDVTRTHGLAHLAAIPRLVAINGAIEVDLFGQVNAERANGVIQAGAGGLPAFAQGALASDGGRLVIGLPSTARGGSVSSSCRRSTRARSSRCHAIWPTPSSPNTASPNCAACRWPPARRH